MVEDDADTRWMLADVLKARGYEVETALDGTQALKRMEASAPDLVTVDLNMPVMDGRTLMERMRTTPVLADVPVLVLSGASEAPDWVKTTKAAGFLHKPFKLDELTRAVERLLPFQPSILPKR